jgi:hypothetical protein
LSFASFIHLAIRDTVKACKDGHLTFRKVNHWWAREGNSYRERKVFREWKIFAVMIRELADSIEYCKTSFDKGEVVSAFMRATHSIFLAVQLHDLLRINEQNSPESKELIEQVSPKIFSEHMKKAINAKHDQPGGSREIRAKIREIWATGKYPSRDKCAENVCGKFKLSYRTTRNALKGTPNPDPWPAKSAKK